MDRKGLGNWGEEKAANYLRRKGYTILERNFSCRFGEIDIIAKRRGYVVFAEVKLRKNANFAEAREFVTASKQQRIISTARLWLSRHGMEELQPRFDVIEIYAPYGEESRHVEINHIEDAFW
jgi:putative endonuclease